MGKMERRGVATATKLHERSGAEMIFGKLWHALSAQFNKLANLFWTADPIAQMQYEYDLAVDQLKGGREGLEQYRALVERVGRQAANNQAHVTSLGAKITSYLQAGGPGQASPFAVAVSKAERHYAGNRGTHMLPQGPSTT